MPASAPICNGQSRVSDTATRLRERIEKRSAHVGIIGLGYVGLPLAMLFARAGFRVTGIDLDDRRISTLRAGESYVTGLGDEEVRHAIASERFLPSTDLAMISELDAMSICVPTPLGRGKDPDLSFVISAAEEIARRLRPGQLIVLESTTYPGTTEEVVLPRLAGTSLRVGEDFFLGYSPERVDPGNKMYSTDNIPKVISGITPVCTELASRLYGKCMKELAVVSSTRVAEMSKLLENTFRSVNIGLANEWAMMCSHLGIDVWEVIRAASTKPFGFMPFYPGPGPGGHCIPIDPLYLQWKARLDGFEPRFIALADDINREMPEYVVSRLSALLEQHNRSLSGARVHVLGVTYKRDVNDVRESPALEIMTLLAERGAVLSYSDPFVDSLFISAQHLMSQPVTEAVLRKTDVAFIVTNHSQFDYNAIGAASPLVFDLRNATQGVPGNHIFRL